MKNTKFLNSSFINAILYVIVGILFCCFGLGTLDILFKIVGVLFVVQGVLSIVRQDVMGGVISIVIGVLVLVLSWFLLTVLLIIFGCLLIVKGGMALFELLKQKGKPDVMAVITAAATMLVGILLIVAKFAAVDAIMFVIGAFFIIDGALALWAALRA